MNRACLSFHAGAGPRGRETTSKNQNGISSDLSAGPCLGKKTSSSSTGGTGCASPAELPACSSDWACTSACSGAELAVSPGRVSRRLPDERRRRDGFFLAGAAGAAAGCCISEPKRVTT